MTPGAHLAGIPVEESLLALAPLGGLVVAWVAALMSRARRGHGRRRTLGP